MSPTAQPYRTPAADAAGAIRPRRVTRVQVALVTAASLGALSSFVLLSPRTSAPPTPPPDAPAAAPAPTTLPLPPVVRAEPRPAIPPRPPPSSQGSAAMEQAQVCLRTGGSSAAVNRCIVNALQGRATTEPEQRLLCVTLRQMGERARAVACMRRYLQIYTDTRYTAQFLEYILDG
jgi:hypothetical protein